MKLTKRKLAKIIREEIRSLTERTTKDDILSIIFANGLDRTDVEYEDQGRMTPNSDKDVSVNIYTDKRTFQNIVGDLESSGIELIDFRYERGQNYGWIAPRIR